MRSLATRAVHALLALCVLHQLVVSLFMGHGHSRDGVVDPAFALHQWGGYASLGVIAVFWLWTRLRGLSGLEKSALGELFPWFSAERRRRLAADFTRHRAALNAGRLASPEETALASAAHGLGLLVMTGMAATGGLWALGAGEAPLALHAGLATFAWAYLIGHAGVALLHEVEGHPVIRAMSPFGRRSGREAGAPEGPSPADRSPA